MMGEMVWVDRIGIEIMVDVNGMEMIGGEDVGYEVRDMIGGLGKGRVEVKVVGIGEEGVGMGIINMDGGKVVVEGSV